jgi:hypothetical protein
MYHLVIKYHQDPSPLDASYMYSYLFCLFTTIFLAGLLLIYTVLRLAITFATHRLLLPYLIIVIGALAYGYHAFN